jgi:AraC-like DNA-binding protein
MDALSELLRAVKLSGALFFNVEASKPWRVVTPTSRDLARWVSCDSTHVIEFHLVTHGEGYIRVGPETISFTAGDLLMIPHGDEHEMGNGSGAPAEDNAKAAEALKQPGVHCSRFGGGGEGTHFICGYLGSEAGLIRPLVAGLPRIVRVHLRTDTGGEWLEKSIRHAVERAQVRAPGSDVITARLAEVLFAEAMQRYVRELPAGRAGWLAGTGDPAVGRSLAALHRRPAHPWTLDELAVEAAVSRSSLTEKFSRYLSQSPMSYLADWRLELGAEALRASSRSVVQVAAEVGYESEAAFNRAFKRRFGKPPGEYRRGARLGRDTRSAVEAQPA